MQGPLRVWYNAAMMQFDLVIARRADGPPPRFIMLMERYAHQAGLSFLHCRHPDQAEELLAALYANALRIGCLVDYMGASFRRDYELGCAVKDSGGLVVDDPDMVRLYGDKAVMHHALVQAGVSLPRTLILRAWQPNRDLTPAERDYLGPRIVLKPARGSGAGGVVFDLDGSAHAIAAAREYDPDDHYLLQEHITPVELGGRPAWFRVYNCFGRIACCFWHPLTHETVGISPQEFSAYGLEPLERIGRLVGQISGYTWCSCEVALARRDERLEWLPIDYLNNKCYLLTQDEVGLHGVPYLVVDAVVREFVAQAAAQRRKLFSAEAQRHLGA
jgi:hypothetical protein